METIKEIGKFLAWWWNGLSSVSRMFIPVFAWVGSVIPGLYFFGPPYILVFFGGFVVFFVFAFAKLIWDNIRETWKDFKSEQEAERQSVVDKLRGNIPDLYSNSPTTPRTPQEILARLRAGKNI